MVFKLLSNFMGRSHTYTNETQAEVAAHRKLWVTVRCLYWIFSVYSSDRKHHFAQTINKYLDNITW